MRPTATALRPQGEPRWLNRRDKYSPEVRADLGGVAETVGIAANVAQTLLDAYAEGVAHDTLEQSLGAVLDQVPPCPYTDEAEGLSELQARWGSHTDYRRKLAGWAADNRGLRPILEQTGYALHPDVVDWMTRRGAEDMIQAVLADRRHPYHRPGTRGHQEQVAAMAQLRAWAQPPRRRARRG